MNLNSLEMLSFFVPTHQRMNFWLWLHSHKHSHENQNNSVKRKQLSETKTTQWNPGVFVLEETKHVDDQRWKPKKAAQDLQSVSLNYFLMHMSINRGAG